MNNSKTFCPNPFIYLTNSTSGKVKYCCLINQGLNDNRGRRFNSSTAKISDVWNSNELNEVRRKMLNGERVQECKKCYQEEDSGGGSLRTDLNHHWQNPGRKEFLEKNVQEYLNKQRMSGPASVEVRTGSICNLKCRMCYPNDSILIEKEYRKIEKADSKWTTLNFGKGSSDINHDNYFQQTINHFPHIQVLRFSGGEPFLNESTERLIDEAARTGHSSHIDLFVNTNFTRITTELLDNLSTFKSVSIDISLDGYKSVHEYIRTGLSWTILEENLEKIKPYLNDKFYLTTNTTVQNLNVLYLEDILKWTIDELKITPVLCVLNNPSWLSVANMPQEMKQEASKRIKELINSETVQNFRVREWLVKRLTNIVETIEIPSDETQYDNFFYFMNTLDKERNQSYCTSLPEVFQFYSRYKK